MNMSVHKNQRIHSLGNTTVQQASQEFITFTISDLKNVLAI
jgi:hypothetical protein